MKIELTAEEIKALARVCQTQQEKALTHARWEMWRNLEIKFKAASTVGFEQDDNSANT